MTFEERQQARMDEMIRDRETVEKCNKLLDERYNGEFTRKLGGVFFAALGVFLILLATGVL